jgi:ABC-type transport system substrate-binding protein
MPDHDARVSALVAQEVDVIYNVPLEAAQPLSNASDIRALPSSVGAYQGLSLMLNGDPPYEVTQDILVRQAIGLAIDRQAITDTVYGGFATPSQTMIPASVLGPYAERVDGYASDPRHAEDLLKRAGWQDLDGDGIREKDGRDLRLELVVGFPSDVANGQTPEVLQAQLAEVGIDVVIKPVADTPTYEELLANRQGDMWLEIGNQHSSSPCFLGTILYYGQDTSPNPWPRAFAPGPAGWPDFDEEIERCNETLDAEGAALHAANAMHILIDQARVVVPLVGLYNIWFTSDEVQGFQPHPITSMARWEPVTLTR